MKTLITLVLLMLCAVITLKKSKKPFPKRGWLCLLFSYAALWVAFFSFGFKWWILLIFGIVFIVGLCIWISVEQENKESLQLSTDAQSAVPDALGNLANNISRDSIFAKTFFGSLANAASEVINNKLGEHGLFTPQESESTNSGRTINKIFFFATLVCIIVAYFFSD